MISRINYVAVTLLVVGLFAASIAPVVAGASPAMKKMATIMHRLKHFPSPQGKEELKQIINNTAATKNEKVLATAMLNLQHHATEADKVKLKVIMDDRKASTDERDLAGIIYNLNHRPTDEDKARLTKMMK